MTENTVDNPETNPEGTEAEMEEARKLANEQLRSHAKKVEDENAALRQQVMKANLAEIGLSSETGLGKAIAKEYEGEYTVDAIGAYAQSEYGYEASTEGAPAEVEAASRTERMQQQSESMEPEPKPSPAEEAAAKMHDPEASREDAQRSLTGKVIQFAEQHYGQEGPQAPPEN